jgi:hypothetical protein
MRQLLLGAIICSAAVTLVSAQQQSAAQLANNAPETFTANAVDISNMRARAVATSVDIHIDRYSTDQERDKLMSVFETKGQDALLDALQHLPVVGYVRTPTSLRYDIHFARQIPQAEGGRKVILLTDRHMAMWEVMNQTRTVDYPFTLVELQLGPDDRGVGKASIATKITKGDHGVIELENFANVPVALNDVRKQASGN